MRHTFAAEINRHLDRGEDLLVLTADLGYSVFEGVQSGHPEAVLNVGIAENTMVGLAAGIALTGQKVLCYGISKFIANKCYEQIREDICLHSLPVVLVGTGSGLSYGHAGYTHFSTEDIACLRTLPGLTILSPADPNELRLLLADSLNHQGPVYLRLGKTGDTTLSDRQSLKIGESYVLRYGTDATVVGHGNILTQAVAAADLLESLGVSLRIVSAPTVKPIDAQAVSEHLVAGTRVYVLEEHSEVGGLGDALARLRPVKLAIPDRVQARSGDQTFLRKLAGINARSIAGQIASDLNLALPDESGADRGSGWGEPSLKAGS